MDKPVETTPLIPSTAPKALSTETLKNTGLVNLSLAQQSRAIYVTNISAKATIKQVADFFSFCGGIEKLVQDFDPNSDPNAMKQFAVIVFENDQTYSIALLLGNSVVEDSPINVHPYAPHDPTLEHDKLKGRTATNVVSQLVASGFIQGEKLIDKMKKEAKDMDEKNHISDKVKSAYDLSIKKCKEVDSNYKFSETLSYYKDKALETTHKLDEQLGIGVKAKEVKDFTVKTVSGISGKAMEIEPIKQGVDFVSSIATSGWGFVTQTFNFFTEETKEEIKVQKEALKKEFKPVLSEEKPVIREEKPERESLEQMNKETDVSEKSIPVVETEEKKE